MRVGDLVRHREKIYHDVTWFGIVTAVKSNNCEPKVFVEWATGEHGWQYCSGLEVACK